jgi:MoxR-like ATPase
MSSQQTAQVQIEEPPATPRRQPKRQAAPEPDVRVQKMYGICETFNVDVGVEEDSKGNPILDKNGDKIPRERKVSGFQDKTEWVPEIDPSYVFPTEETKIILLGLELKDRMLLVGETGTGKCVTCDTKIPTPKGWCQMGDLKIGDEVFGTNGNATRVVGVYPQGMRSTYKIVFRDGVSVIADADHLWAVGNTNWERDGHEWKIRTTEQLLTAGLHKKSGKKASSEGRAKYWIPTANPIQFEDCKKLPLDPYLLGVLLGDGCLANHSSVVVWNPELDVIQSLKLPEGDNLSPRKASAGKCPAWGITGGVTRFHLRGLELQGCRAEDKFIPELYKWSSTEDRLALLRGLCDTDGHVDRSGAMIEYCTVSKRLAKDVQFLVQSLGGLARIVEKEPTYTYKGVSCQGQLAYRIGIHMPDELVPVSSQKHLSRYKGKQGQRYLRTIESIEPTGEAECVCIKVDADDELFLVNDFIVTHNTSLLEQVAARLNYNVVKINFDGAVTRQDLIGEWVIKGRQMTFQYGILVHAFKMPGTIIILDEWDTISGECAFVLQRPLQKDDGKILIMETGGELCPLHPDNVLAATANTCGQGDDTGLYSHGTKVQNYSQLNRFGLTIRMKYLDPEKETEMIGKRFPELTKAESKALVRAITTVREAYMNGEISAPLSPRDLINWADKYIRIGCPIRAAKFCFLNRMPDEDHLATEAIIQRSFQES